MAADLELKDDATREDVAAMVKDYMEERASTTGDDDAKNKTAGDDDVHSVVADDAAASQDKAGGEDSDAKETKSDNQKWLTDDVRAELPRWISDEDLSEFSSRDELDRALGLMDRAALKAGRDAGKPRDDEDQDADKAEKRSRERSQDGKFVKQQKQEDVKGKGESPASFDVDLDLSEFDEDLSKKVKGALTGLRDHYEGRMKSLDERFAAIEADNQLRATQAVESQFDSIVDSLGHTDLFGKAGEESEKQLEARRTLFDETHVYLTGLKALGRTGRMDAASVGRVLRMAFADHISKQEQKNLTKRITRQSNMRMGVGAERPADQEFKGPLRQHPDIQRAYKALQEARGED